MLTTITSNPISNQQAERKALAAAQETVQRMNEKNLEKGAELDKDAQNEELQKALREQQRHTPSKATPTEKRVKNTAGQTTSAAVVRAAGQEDGS